MCRSGFLVLVTYCVGRAAPPLIYGFHRPPRRGGGGNHGQWPGIAPSADGAGNDWGISRRARRDQRLCLGKPRFGLFAVRWQEWSARDFSSGQDAGSQPYVCMARNRSAVLAEKIRRAPQTHGRWTALTRKNRVKLLFWGFQIVAISYWGISLESTSVKYSGSSQRTVTGSSVRGCRNVNSRAWRHWLSMPSSGFLWP